MVTAERHNEINYNATVRQGEDVYTQVGLDLFKVLTQEAQNRDPEFYELHVNNEEWIKEAEMEVIENALTSFQKLYKNAIKKKSPQSAWKPVYSTLEGLTLFLRSKEAWFEMKDHKRAEEAFKAFGNAWVSMAERLSKLGSFNQTAFPSVRTMVSIAVTIGNGINEKLDKPLSEWPEKLLCVWTGNEFAGDKKAKERDVDGEAKKKKASKAGKPETEKKVVKTRRQLREEAEVSQWDFKNQFMCLKDGRKKIGGSAHDLSQIAPEQRELVVAATAAA